MIKELSGYSTNKIIEILRFMYLFEFHHFHANNVVKLVEYDEYEEGALIRTYESIGIVGDLVTVVSEGEYTDDLKKSGIGWTYSPRREILDTLFQGYFHDFYKTKWCVDLIDKITTRILDNERRYYDDFSFKNERYLGFESRDVNVTVDRIEREIEFHNEHNDYSGKVSDIRVISNDEYREMKALGLIAMLALDGAELKTLENGISIGNMFYPDLESFIVEMEENEKAQKRNAESVEV